MIKNLFGGAFAVLLLISCTDDIEKKLIVCWGDSLTAPHNENGMKQVVKNILTPIHDFDISYPNQMANMLPNSFTIVNCGVGGENTLAIMGRQGAAPLLLAHDVTILKENPVVIGNRDIPAFVSSWDSTSTVNILNQSYWTNGGSHVNPAYINDKAIELDSDDSYFYMHNGHVFYEYTYRLKILNRHSKTTHDTLRTFSPIITQAMRDYRNAWCNVFFIGQNGGFRDAAELVRQIKAMINYSRCNNYIVISFHKPNTVIPTPKRMSEMEDTLAHTFGKHFINLRRHMLQYGLAEAGMTATKEDRDSIAHGNVPPQLMVDGCHFTKQGYKIIAKLVEQKIRAMR